MCFAVEQLPNPVLLLQLGGGVRALASTQGRQQVLDGRLETAWPGPGAKGWILPLFPSSLAYLGPLIFVEAIIPSQLPSRIPPRQTTNWGARGSSGTVWRHSDPVCARFGPAHTPNAGICQPSHAFGQFGVRGACPPSLSPEPASLRTPRD